MNRAGELARSVSVRNDGLLNGILVHPNKVSEGQWTLHVITEWVNPKFVFAVSDEHGDAERIETGFQQISGQRPQRLAVAANTCSICSWITLCTVMGWSPPVVVQRSKTGCRVHIITGQLAYPPADAAPGAPSP